jgi:DNA-binding SARP family transcriptional activator
MRHKLPVGMILERILEEGDANGLGVLVGEMVHLPKARDFAASTEMMAKAFRSNKALGDDESLMLHAHKLASMSKRLFKDRENQKPVLERARAVLAEWAAWVEADDPAEDEIQEHLERVAEAMAEMNAALNAYDSFVLAKLKGDRGIE